MLSSHKPQNNDNLFSFDLNSHWMGAHRSKLDSFLINTVAIEWLTNRTGDEFVRGEMTETAASEVSAIIIVIGIIMAFEVGRTHHFCLVRVIGAANEPF